MLSQNIKLSYYEDYLLNGTEMIVKEAMGADKIDKGIINLLDNGHIIFYCGVNLI
jgi:hypothetical protein